MTNHEEIAALESAIAQIADVLTDPSIPAPRRDNLGEVLRTLRAMRMAILGDDARQRVK